MPILTPPADPVGQSGHAPMDLVCQWDLPPAVKDFYHAKIAHILVSVYFVFFQPHSTSEPITSNNINIIDLVYTCIITSSDSSLAPIARHLITYSISTKLSE